MGRCQSVSTCSDSVLRRFVPPLVLLLCACAHSPTDPRERLSWYRQNAERPVADFAYVRNMRWEALGNQALAVWPRRDAGFLLEMASPCPGLDEAGSIRLSHGDGRVRSRVDSVQVLLMPGSPPVRRPACPIHIISPIRRSPSQPSTELREVTDDTGA